MAAVQVRAALCRRLEREGEAVEQLPAPAASAGPQEHVVLIPCLQQSGWQQQRAPQRPQTRCRAGRRFPVGEC